MAERSSALPQGTYILEWRGIELHAQLTAFQDERARRVAVHQVLWRHGGEAEDMGRAPHKHQETLVFVGNEGLKTYRRFLEAYDENPRGLLVHPLYGKMQACCVMVKSQVEIQGGANTILCPVEFVENAYDLQLSAEGSSGVSGSAQEATQSVTDWQSEASAYLSAATVAATLATKATEYIAAVQASAVASTLDSSLATRLDDVRIATAAAIIGVQADAAYTSDAVDYDALIAAETVYDACVRLDDALRARRPRMEIVRMPVPIHVALLAAQRYGKDGAARIDEILCLNPDIEDAGVIPAGSELLLAAATV